MSQTIPRSYGGNVQEIANAAAASATPAAGSVVAASMSGTGEVATASLAAGAVTAPKLGANAIAVGNTAIAPGAVTPDQQGLTITNKTGTTLTAGTLVFVSGYDTGTGHPSVTRADAKTGNSRATFVVIADIANNAAGTIARRWLSAATLDTSLAAAVGSLVYSDTSNGTIGGWITAAPAYRVDIVGVVVVKSASVGQIYFDLSMTGQSTVNVGNSGDLVAGTIGSTQIADTAVTPGKLSAAAATRTLQALVGTLATAANEEVIVVSPVTGNLTLVTLSGKDALATDDTNYQAFTLTNKGQAGAGTTDMLSQTAGAKTTKITGGQALVAYGKTILAQHATAGNAAVVKGDTLVFTATHNGTPANTVTECVLALEFTVTS